MQGTVKTTLTGGKAVPCARPAHLYQQKAAYTVLMNAAFANDNVSGTKIINYA